MEKRNWLWKKKSSEKGTGESEGSGGSISSHSERFSDDQEALKVSTKDDSRSPEVTSKNSAGDEEVDDSTKCLTEKLAAALVNMSEKDDLVKQHSKVAEEAVAGWEKAENEVEVLKKQLQAAAKQKSLLEDRLSHVDGALKECVRQLRQSQEEQEVKIREAVSNKTKEWESIKSELEKQIVELKTEDAKTESFAQVDPLLYRKLEYLEEENESLRLQLLSQSEGIEVRTIERDLSTQAAETASKQHLESIKKLAKLEAECRRLKVVACRSSSSLNDHKATAASSVYLDSDFNSDGGERLNALGTPNRNLPATAVEIDLMDDFLEMERLAAMPESESGRSNRVESEGGVNRSSDAESLLRVELELAIRQSADLEGKLNEMQEVKDELEQSLETMKLEKAEAELSLEKMIEEKAQVETWLEEMEGEKAEVESCLEKMTAEKEQVERSLEEMEEKRAEMESCLEKMLTEKARVERWLEETESEKAVVQLRLEKTIAERAQVERSLEEMEAEKFQLGTSLTRSEDEKQALEIRMREVELTLEEVQTLLSSTKESKQDIEFQLTGLEAKCRALSAQVASLETELEEERSTSVEFGIKFQYLEEELARKQEEFEHQQSISLNSGPKIKQEDLALAAGKLAECQNTILSLGNQLKSLATLEDFLIDSSSTRPEISAGNCSLARRGSGELWKLHSNGTYSPKKDSTSSSSRVGLGSPSPSQSPSKHERCLPSSSSTLMHSTSSDKNRNGFAKFFSRSKNGIQLEL